MRGPLAKKGKHGVWSARFFALRGSVLEYYEQDPAIGASESAPKGAVNVSAVFDVPDRGGTFHANRLDVEFACCAGDDGAELAVFELAAERAEDKVAWLAALSAAARIAPLATHPRLAEMRHAAPQAVEVALQREARELGSMGAPLSAGAAVSTAGTAAEAAPALQQGATAVERERV